MLNYNRFNDYSGQHYRKINQHKDQFNSIFVNTFVDK